MQYLTVKEVCKLLKGLGLKKCIPIIKKEGIDGCELSNYTPDEFMSLLLRNGFSKPKARSSWQKLESYLKPTAGRAINHRMRALVVGINKYVGDLRPLKNAVKDAIDMAKKLESAGVIVTLVTDVTIDGFKAARDEYLSSLNQGDVGLLFYAGHGHMLNNTQRMMAIPKGEKANFKTDTLRVEVLLNQMSRRKTKANITFLDCCRDFKYNETRGGQSVEDSVQAVVDDVKGSVISYACSPNHTAHDGGDVGHGLYTQCLLRHLLTPNIDVHEMLRRVNIDLNALSKELGLEQTPYLSTSLNKFLCLFSSENTSSKIHPEPVALE